MALPSTIGQLALLVALLLPGLAFSLHREWHLPRPKVSAFRESASVLFAGVAVDILVAVIAVAALHFFPSLGVDWQFSAASAATITAPEFSSVFWRAIVLLLFAIAIGWFAGGRAARKMASKLRLVDNGRSEGSVWWILFDQKQVPEGTIPYVGIELNDGQWFEGYVSTFSTVTDDTPDRELTLVHPIKYREAGGNTDPEVMDGVDAVALSARQMRFVRVTYLPDAESKTTPNVVPLS